MGSPWEARACNGADIPTLVSKEASPAWGLAGLEPGLHPGPVGCNKPAQPQRLRTAPFSTSRFRRSDI